MLKLLLLNLLLLILLLLMIMLLMVLLLVLWTKVEGPCGGRAKRRSDHGIDVVLRVVMKVLSRVVARRCLRRQRGWDQFSARIFSPSLPCSSRGRIRMDRSGVVLMVVV